MCSSDLAHWEKVSARREIEVPEWDLTVYVTPMSLHDKGLIAKTAETKGMVDAMVHAIVLKCEDKDGNKLFTIEDKESLRRAADPDIIERLSNTISRAPSIEDMAGNLPRHQKAEDAPSSGGSTA